MPSYYTSYNVAGMLQLWFLSVNMKCLTKNLSEMWRKRIFPTRSHAVQVSLHTMSKQSSSTIPEPSLTTEASTTKAVINNTTTITMMNHFRLRSEIQPVTWTDFHRKYASRDFRLKQMTLADLEEDRQRQQRQALIVGAVSSLVRKKKPSGQEEGPSKQHQQRAFYPLRKRARGNQRKTYK